MQISGLMIFAFIAVVGFIGYIIFDKLYIKRKNQNQGKLFRILLFERVGDTKAYKGEYTGTEINDDKLGLYIMIDKIKKPIMSVGTDEFFYDHNYGRSILVCKYSDDDYRIMSHIKGDYYAQQLVEKVKLNEHGVPINDDDGNPETYYEPDYVKLNEPVGITQQGREAMRFYSDFKIRMEEVRGEKAKFWEKYGNYIMLTAMLIIILISTAYNANKFEQASENMAKAFGEKAQGYIDEVNSPQFAQNIMDRIRNNEAASNTPPS